MTGGSGGSGGKVGAELSSLRDLHTTFKNKAQEAIDIKTHVDKGVQNAVWTGTFAENFRNSWHDYRRNLDNLHDALHGAAQDVKTNHNNIAAATGEPDRI